MNESLSPVGGPVRRCVVLWEGQEHPHGAGGNLKQTGKRQTSASRSRLGVPPPLTFTSEFSYLRLAREGPTNLLSEHFDEPKGKTNLFP